MSEIFEEERAKLQGPRWSKADSAAHGERRLPRGRRLTRQGTPHHRGHYWRGGEYWDDKEIRNAGTRSRRCATTRR